MNAQWWIITCASLAAAGVGLILTAGRPRQPRGLAARLGLVQVEQRRPLVDRLFGHLAEHWLQRQKDQSALLTQLQHAGMYQRAGAQYPDERVFYAYTLAIAAGLGVVGVVADAGEIAGLGGGEFFEDLENGGGGVPGGEEVGAAPGAGEEF